MIYLIMIVGCSMKIEFKGRIIRKIKNKKIDFMILDTTSGRIQLVFKNDDRIYKLYRLINVGDIVEGSGDVDAYCEEENSISKNSLVVNTIYVVNKRIIQPDSLPDFSKIREYSMAKTHIREYLVTHGYIEVPIPILTDGEISSLAKSYETETASGEKLFLRKTMDTFLRMYSCMDFHKIYSIGQCFRNCFPTQNDFVNNT